MARFRTPNLRHHKPSQLGVVTLNGRDFYLGHWPRDQNEAPQDVRTEYDRKIAEWLSNGRQLPGATAAPRGAATLTVSELIATFWPNAERHYVHPDGTPTSELEDFRLSLRPLRRLYGGTCAADFGPLALKAVRQAIVDGSWLTDEEKTQRQKKGHKLACCRSVANQRTGRIRRLFRWAVEQELVPPAVLQALQAVRDLPKGRGHARETEPVKPVQDDVVEATLPFLRPQVRAMVMLQRHAGMRPGEVCVMRGIDIDTTGTVWTFTPGSDQGPSGKHKTAWRGHRRVIQLGPKAREVLRPWLRLNPTEYLFQPREATASRDQDRAARRKTKKTPSQKTRRRKRNPKRQPSECYSVGTYGRAIERACVLLHCKTCKKCQRQEGEDRTAWEKRIRECQGLKALTWNPNQLRHASATEIRKVAGLDAARVVLGHRSPSITETYAEIDTGKAAEIMERLG